MDDAEPMLSNMNRLVGANTKTISFLGARTMVLGKFLVAALPCLTTAQCFEISEWFGREIEDAMSQMDDMALPAEYHSAILDQTNAILVALDQQATVHG
jgi:hypothetical protein